MSIPPRQRSAVLRPAAKHPHLQVDAQLGEFTEIQLAVGALVVDEDELARNLGAEVGTCRVQRLPKLGVVQIAAAVTIVTRKRRGDVRGDGGGGGARARGGGCPRVTAAVVVGRGVFPCA